MTGEPISDPLQAAALANVAAMDAPRNLADFPLHLGLGGVVQPLPRFTGSGEWYQAYENATVSDGSDGRLVSWHEFNESWTTWEMHPAGDEIVLCVSGRITLIQDVDGEPRNVTLSSGEWWVNAPGVWHTADIATGESATCIFVTVGAGTMNRDRD